MKNKLAHTEGRVIIRMDMNYKNSHTFEDGTKITLERKYDNFDQKYTQPVNAIVVSAGEIPEGAEVICHHNVGHDTNRIHNYTNLSGAEIASDIRYFSISENEVFAWFDESTQSWQPLKGYDFALRVFKPYIGILEGVEPTLVKDVLWITTGEYKNKACITLKACDYQLIFQDRNGREKNIIRLRTEDRPKEHRESEVVAIHNEYTGKIMGGAMHVGLTKSDAKSLNEYVCQ